MLKFLLLMGLALACQGYMDDTCEACFDGGTYKCGTNDTMPCICHVSFTEITCKRQEKFCSDSQCGRGKCVFLHGTYQCECPEGVWGRLCEHTDAEVAHLADNEKELAKKYNETYCKDEEECVPPHLRVVCSNEDLDLCDEEGNVRPYKKCPYPWYCFEAFRNGKCDWECERSECLYDGYECSTNRVCNSSCVTESGTCDLECNLKSKIEDNPSMAVTTTLIEFTLGVTEQFWWEHKRDIIANISEPLRTPLVYSPRHNEVLEKNKNSLEKVLSRGRRSISEGNGVTVNLFLMDKACAHESECTKDGTMASRVLATEYGREKFDSRQPILLGIKLDPEYKKSGNGTLAVCFVIIAVPIVLIGYRVVSAPIWVPPKSEDEAPVIWCTDVPPYNPIIRTPNSLHEEAYSLSKIRLPIQREYVNGLDQQGRTPLFWLIASKKSCELMIEDLDELMNAGANANHCDDKGETPLSIAITALRPSICVRLVGRWGANPAAATHSGASCLHLAVAQDYIHCVEWLLTNKSVLNNINEVDESDRTPLAMAAQGGTESAQIAEMLIMAGADVLHQGNHYTMWRYRGRAALHWAALFNNLEVMKVLLAHRSDVNCVDTEGNTALHLAVQRGSEDAVRMLLEAHASTEIHNGLGLIPLTIAKKTGIQNLIVLLTWYTDVRKEGLVMKKKRKREKRPSDSGSCSLESPTLSDSISTNSGSMSSGYFFPSIPSDSSSVSSGTSMMSSISGSSHSVQSYGVPSYQWSPLSPISQQAYVLPSPVSQQLYVLPKKARPCSLSPIEEKPMEYFSLDSLRSESYIPPGQWTVGESDSYMPQGQWTEGDRRESVSGESGVGSDYPLDSFLLSPYSEPSNGSGGPESPPMEHLGAGYWTEQDQKPVDGFSHEDLLQEFFVNWQT